MDLTKKKCVPCEGYTDPLTNEEEDKFLPEVKNWEIVREGTHFFLVKSILIPFIIFCC